MEDNLFILNNIIEAAKMQGVLLYLAFIDLKKAFDTVDSNILWTALAAMGLPQHFVEIIKSLYANTTHKKVLWNGQTKKSSTRQLAYDRGARYPCYYSYSLPTKSPSSWMQHAMEL